MIFLFVVVVHLYVCLSFPLSHCEDNNSRTLNDRNSMFIPQYLTVEQMIQLDFCQSLLHKFAY